MTKTQPRFKYILWDVDGTLVNFEKSEKVSLKQCFLHYGIEPTEDDYQVYSKINRSYWLRLEQGLLNKRQVCLGRFADFFDFLGVKNIDAEEMNDSFQKALAENCVENDGAYELCKQLGNSYRQYIVTNGTKVAQTGKLKNSGLGELMDGVFISEVIGYEKPDVRFFQRCFEQIPGFSREQAIIVGDSLTSDMLGGNNAGIACCWFNPQGLAVPENAPKLDFIIKTLSELKEII